MLENKTDLWTLLLCTVRYAMGRRSYIVSEACGLVKKYEKYLTEQQRDQIYKEVKEELARYNRVRDFLGDECDHMTWTDFVSSWEKK